MEELPGLHAERPTATIPRQQNTRGVLKPFSYDVIVADVPLDFENYSESGTSRASQRARKENNNTVECGSELGQLAYADGRDASTEGLQRSGEHGQRAQDGGAGERVADAGTWRRGSGQRHLREQTGQPDASRRGAAGWSDAEWIACIDGKARPVEPGTFPLASGIPARVGRLRAYGNAIVPQVAAEFIGAVMELRP